MIKWKKCLNASLLVSACSVATIAGTTLANEPEICLTRDGKPQASIVVSRTPTRAAAFAVVELRDHIKKISGAELPIVSDTNEVTGTRILVGESAATRALGLKNGDFKTQEYMIGIRKGALVLMGRDADNPAPPAMKAFASQAIVGLDSLPLDEDVGACDAVYQFLERNCGVRWYGPTEIGAVIPSKPTLVVQIKEIRRQPSFAWRCTMPDHALAGLMPSVAALWANPTRAETRLYQHRMHVGGERFICTHSFYGFYDSFWHKNPKNEAAWESQHLEWFAHGYDGQPPQMCLNSTGFIGQVVADARNFFDGKGGKHGERVFGNFFALGPMDTADFCRCPMCLSQVNGKEAANQYFSNGKYSDYFFGFCNKVAHEVRKTHPDKYVSALTYMYWARHPSFRLEPNIAIQLCLGGNTCFDDPANKVTGRDIWGLYREWIDREGGKRPIYLWLYSQFPECLGIGNGFTAFPGFGSRLIGRQMQMFHRDGIRGLFPEGITTQLNAYMYNQMAFDATQDPDQIFAEFFTLYYGAAAKPMRKLWTEIEETYTNPANYPEEVRTQDKDFSQTEEWAWKHLGTDERMARWAVYMEAAKAAAKTEVEKARVQLFEQGQWAPMVTAKRVYANKVPHQVEVEQSKKLPPPSAKAPAIPNAGGDLGKVDWSKAGHMAVTHTHEGYPSERQIAVEIACDTNYLYLRLSDPVARDKVKVEGGVFDGDRWEIFVAAQCAAKDYRQFGIKPDGRLMSLSYPGGQEFDSGIQAKCQLSDKGWIAELAVPLALVRALPQASADTVYLNLYRPASGGQSTLAWSPNFAGGGYNNPARLGAVTLDK